MDKKFTYLDLYALIKLNTFHNPENKFICYSGQGIFCPALGAKFRPHSQLKIANFFPIPCLFYPIKKSIFFYFFFLETTTTYEKQ